MIKKARTFTMIPRFILKNESPVRTVRYSKCCSHSGDWRVELLPVTFASTVEVKDARSRNSISVKNYKELNEFSCFTSI